MLVLVAIAFLVYLKGNFTVSWDLAVYMAHADNYLNERGMVSATGIYTGSRPLFVMLLAALQATFGKSAVAIGVFEALVSALLLATLFAFARWLFGMLVARAVALVFLCTPAMVFWLPRHVDAVWPLGIMASLLLWLCALEQRERRTQWAAVVAAGVLAALSIKIKETAVLFFLIPLAAIAFDPRARSWRLHAALFAAAIGAYLLFGMTNPGSGASAAVSRRLAGGLELRVGGWNANGYAHLLLLALRGLRDYFVNHGSMPAIHDIVPLWWLGLAGLGWTAHRAWRTRDTKACYVVCLFLAYLPFATFAGMQAMRPSQSVVTIMCLFLGFGALLHAVGAWCRNHGHARAGTAVIVLLTVLAVAFQFQADTRHLRRVGGEAWLTRALSGDPALTHSARGSELARWIDRNRDLVRRHGDTLVVSDIVEQHVASWYLDAPPQLLNPPLRQVGDGTRWSYYPDGLEPAISATDERPATFLIHGWRSPKPGVPILALSQPGAERWRNERHAALYAIHMIGIGPPLLAWLEQAYRLEHIAEIGAGRYPTKVVRLLAPRPANELAPTHIDARIAGYLAFVHEREPWRTPPLDDTLLRGDMGLNAAQARELRAAAGRTHGFVLF